MEHPALTHRTELLFLKPTLSMENETERKEVVLKSRGLQNNSASVRSTSQKPLFPAKILFSESGGLCGFINLLFI